MFSERAICEIQNPVFIVENGGVEIGSIVNSGTIERSRTETSAKAGSPIP